MQILVNQLGWSVGSSYFIMQHGVLVAIWAIAFVAMTERVRGGRIKGSGAIEESAVR